MPTDTDSPSLRQRTRSSATSTSTTLVLNSTKRVFANDGERKPVLTTHGSRGTVKRERADVQHVDLVQVQSGLEETTTETKPVRKKRRKGDYADLGDDPLTDRIKEGLLCLALGENPGMRTAELQLHYASPANHFYKCLHAAGLTPSVLEPSASRTIHEDYGVGITNLIARPTMEASELTKTELAAAVPVFLRKVALYRPRVVFFVGMKVGDTVLSYFSRLAPATPAPTLSQGKGKAKKPPPVKAQIGWQPFAVSHPPSQARAERETTHFYCLPSTSGRVAAYPLPVKLKLWAAFGHEVDKLRAVPPEPLNLPTDLVVTAVEDLPGVLVKKEEPVE
ncbi:hypothetical protein JCM10207_002091 [Rhodosporidiobolus poonsookiae]